MKLHVLGSSSSGNGYILEAAHSALIIEAGMPLRQAKKAIDYQIGKVAACIITHEHGDHAGRVKEYLQDTAMEVCASHGTAEALSQKTGRTRRRNVRELKSGIRYDFGEFAVIPQLLAISDKEGMHCTHDAAEPFCYQIYHKEMGAVLFATDTYCLPCKFTGLTTAMIECNYAKEILDEQVAEGRVDYHRRNRTILSHMSLETCRHELLTKTNVATLKRIVLLHGSPDNGDPERFKREISTATGTRTYVAEAGMTINFDRLPF